MILVINLFHSKQSHSSNIRYIDQTRHADTLSTCSDTYPDHARHDDVNTTRGIALVYNHVLVVIGNQLCFIL